MHSTLPNLYQYISTLRSWKHNLKNESESLPGDLSKDIIWNIIRIQKSLEIQHWIITIRSKSIQKMRKSATTQLEFSGEGNKITKLPYLVKWYLQYLLHFELKNLNSIICGMRFTCLFLLLFKIGFNPVFSVTIRPGFKMKKKKKE